MPAKRKRKLRNHFGGYDAPEHLDAELLIEAEALASTRENTSVPGRRAVQRALRDIIDARRRRNAQAEAIAAIGEDPGLVFDGAGEEDDGVSPGRVLDDWRFDD